MAQKNLAKWLKFIILGVGACALFVYSVILPMYGQGAVLKYPEFAYCYKPWLWFLWSTGLPVLAALVLCWRIASNIGRDRSFSLDNARLLKWISWLAAADSGYFFIGNIVMLGLGMSHPGVTLLSFLVVFCGVAVTVAAAALSHLVLKAADLEEQNELTI